MGETMMAVTNETEIGCYEHTLRKYSSSETKFAGF